MKYDCGEASKLKSKAKLLPQLEGKASSKANPSPDSRPPSLGAQCGKRHVLPDVWHRHVL